MAAKKESPSSLLKIRVSFFSDLAETVSNKVTQRVHVVNPASIEVQIKEFQTTDWLQRSFGKFGEVRKFTRF